MNQGVASLTITAKASLERNKNFNDIWRHHHHHQSLTMAIFIIVIVICCCHRHHHFFINFFHDFNLKNVILVHDKTRHHFYHFFANLLMTRPLGLLYKTLRADTTFSISLLLFSGHMQGTIST